MLPKYHLLYGFAFASILLAGIPEIGWPGALVILASTFLIDVDHYLTYLFRAKDLSLKNAFNYFIRMRNEYGLTSRKGVKSPILIFHIGETIILTAILSFFNKIFLWILIGFVFHLFLDFVDMYRLNVLNQRDYFAMQRIWRKYISKKRDSYKYI